MVGWGERFDYGGILHTVFRVWDYPIGSGMTLKGLKLRNYVIRFHFR